MGRYRRRGVSVSVTELMVSVRVSDSIFFPVVCHLEATTFLSRCASLFLSLLCPFDMFGLKSPAMLETSLVLPI